MTSCDIFIYKTKIRLTFRQYLDRQNQRSPLSIESILSNMSTNVIQTFSKEGEESSEDFNNNSFLMKSERFDKNVFSSSSKDDIKEGDCEEMKEEDEDGDMEEECKEEAGCKDHEVLSINMEDSFDIEENSTGQYSCHLCSFVCIKKQEFQEHLLTHYTYSCSQCDYASRTEGRLKRHVKDFHSSNSPENFSGQKVPSNNPKSLKCKHCGIISSTKEKHWSHQRTHLDVTKCLQCPKCPFITEYKHHLEYHIRNHDKIKPYKCSKCQYRCVNKSMLNSHKKSHSNVYQFRCADCSYASKYCHSLKQHLTRHGHQPAPVLNEDGSLPTYDNSNEILSMKRGPNNRSLSSHNSSNSLPDHSQSFPLIPQVSSSITKPDIPIISSAFSVFKKDQIDSLLNWTIKQCYPLPVTRFLPSSFPLLPPMPPIPSLMSFSSAPSFPKDSSLFQSSALDLSVKSKPFLEAKSPSLECSLCRMQFHDQKLLEGHVLFHGRFNNFHCNKCGALFNNVNDFFAHFSHKCRD